MKLREKCPHCKRGNLRVITLRNTHAACIKPARRIVCPRCNKTARIDVS